MSKCIYCNSEYYGSPCVFSPTNTHVHFGESDKCIYCGSTSSGSGCSYNPYGKNHIKGPEFLNRSNIQSERALVLNYMINQLVQENLNYKSPLDRFYKRTSLLISNISQPLLEALSLQETPVYCQVDKKQLTESFELRQNIIKKLKELNSLVSEANLKLPPELVEESILDAILASNED